MRALTGIDTDRLEEEKRRGISIELGFAHLTLGDDLRIGFVDVPGHERFVKNMLAGASGIDLALLVVAATESIKPQTREHFDICRLLGIPAGLIAITKADLVDPEIVELVKLELEELTAGSFLEGAPAVPVSAISGSGLEVLKSELRKAALAVSTKSSKSWFRLPVDRAFTMKGFGAVVTGTLASGQVALEEEVEIHPGGLLARVRGLQVHGAAAKRAVAGQRTAVNLAGIELEQLHRGQVLAAKGRFRASDRYDVKLTLLESAAAPLKARSPVHLHAGTAEIEAVIAPFGHAKAIEPGTEVFARVTLAEPALLLPGDRFIIRRFSPVVTIGGGTILDPAPPRKSGPDRLRRLQADRIGTLLSESRYGMSVDELIARTGLDVAAITRDRVILKEPQPWLVDAATIERETARINGALAQFHRENPLLPAMPKESLRGAMPSFLFEHLLGGTPAWIAEGEGVRLKTHRVVMQTDESAALEKIEQLFAQAGLAVPATNEVLAQSGIDQSRAKTLLQTLLRDRKLVRINLELVYHASAITQLRALLGPKKGSRFSVAEFKDWTGVSRKYAIPLLEFLDRERVTRRDGDARVVN